MTAIAAVQAVSSAAQLSTTGAAAGQGAAAPQTFSQALSQALGQVVGAQQQANQMAASFALGGPVSIDQVMIATARAELLTQAAAAVTSRALSAYQSLMQTNIG